MNFKKTLKRISAFCLTLLFISGLMFSNAPTTSFEQNMKPEILKVEEDSLEKAKVEGLWWGMVIPVFLNVVFNVLSKPFADIAQAYGWLDPDTWSVMSNYTVNLNEEVEEGNITGSFGRDKEYKMLSNYITDDEKGHVILVGDSGVGKTKLVEGLAYKIVNEEFMDPELSEDAPENIGKLPVSLKGKEIIKVNMVDLIAGKNYNQGAGAIGRMRALFKKARENPNYILFIDEVHQVAQAGAAELFKSYLDHGEIKIITATTTKEYEHIEKDLALARRFTKMLLDEPNQTETLEILKGLAQKIKENKEISVDESVLLSIVKLTGRFMPKQSYPSKAVDIMNSATRIVVSRKRNIITEGDIRDIISSETGIPINFLNDQQMAEINHLEDYFKQYLTGQDDAIKITCDAYRNWRLGFSDPDKPISSFIFCGNSGTGKTLLAELWGEKIGNLIKINMAKYNSPASVTELIGSKIYGYSGELTDQVWEKPHSVILLDEFEKADPTVQNIISGMLESGYITNGKGEKIDFRNTMVIMTLNNNKEKAFQDNEDVTPYIAETLGRDFLYRMIKIICFKNLDENQNKNLAKIMLSSLQIRLSELDITLNVDNEIFEKIAKTKVDVHLGSRKIKKLIKDEFETPLTEMYLKRKLKPCQTVICSLDENKNFKFEVLYDENEKEVKKIEDNDDKSSEITDNNKVELIE